MVNYGGDWYVADEIFLLFPMRLVFGTNRYEMDSESVVPDLWAGDCAGVEAAVVGWVAAAFD